MSAINTLRIPRSPSLDPITVYLEEPGPGQGRATIVCYNAAWTCFWGAMGDRTLLQFIAGCDEHYVSGNMLSGRHRVASHEREYAARVARAVIDAAKSEPAKERCDACGDAGYTTRPSGSHTCWKCKPTPTADEKVLWGVVANAGRLSRKREFRWVHVAEATAQGSQSSAALCSRFGFDPDEQVGGRRG